MDTSLSKCNVCNWTIEDPKNYGKTCRRCELRIVHAKRLKKQQSMSHHRSYDITPQQYQMYVKNHQEVERWLTLYPWLYNIPRQLDVKDLYHDNMYDISHLDIMIRLPYEWTADKLDEDGKRIRTTERKDEFHNDISITVTAYMRNGKCMISKPQSIDNRLVHLPISSKITKDLILHLETTVTVYVNMPVMQNDGVVTLYGQFDKIISNVVIFDSLMNIYDIDIALFKHPNTSAKIPLSRCKVDLPNRC